MVYITNHTTLDLSHRKFAVRYTPRLQLGVYLTANFLRPRSRVVYSPEYIESSYIQYNSSSFFCKWHKTHPSSKVCHWQLLLINPNTSCAKVCWFWTLFPSCITLNIHRKMLTVFEMGCFLYLPKLHKLQTRYWLSSFHSPSTHSKMDEACQEFITVINSWACSLVRSKPYHPIIEGN